MKVRPLHIQTKMKALLCISSSGLWSFPFCADRWKTNQRACGTARYVICVIPSETNTEQATAHKKCLDGFKKSQTELNQEL